MRHPEKIELLEELKKLKLIVEYEVTNFTQTTAYHVTRVGMSPIDEGGNNFDLNNQEFECIKHFLYDLPKEELPLYMSDESIVTYVFSKQYTSRVTGTSLDKMENAFLYKRTLMKATEIHLVLDIVKTRLNGEHYESKICHKENGGTQTLESS